jgi:hypothetical protein
MRVPSLVVIVAIFFILSAGWKIAGWRAVLAAPRA